MVLPAVKGRNHPLCPWSCPIRLGVFEVPGIYNCSYACMGKGQSKGSALHSLRCSFCQWAGGVGNQTWINNMLLESSTQAVLLERERIMAVQTAQGLKPPITG